MPHEGHATPAFAEVARTFGRHFGAPSQGGGALVIRRHGEVVVDVWAGYADTLGERPWTRDTLAVSFSTTKGVASTVIHRLAERGLLDYDEPVATWWPEFAASGKERITLRQVLCHCAGLHDVRAIAPNAEAMLDHLAMEERLAARPATGRLGGPAYHALTFGWLVAGIARRVTGKGMAELVRTEISEPLGISGLNIGLPCGHEFDLAEMTGHDRVLAPLARLIGSGRPRPAALRTIAQALFVPGFERLLDGPYPGILNSEMPAANGAFSAHALASLYAAIAGQGSTGGVEFLKPDTVRRMGELQTGNARDAVIGFPMRWRLGYHQAIPVRAAAPQAFGHYGYAGSGAWADPASGLSLGFVTNRPPRLSTPVGDLALFRITRRAVAAALSAPPTG